MFCASCLFDFIFWNREGGDGTMGLCLVVLRWAVCAEELSPDASAERSGN